MPGEQKSSGSGCLKIAGGGCLAMILLAVVAVVGIWVSRDAIMSTKWFRSIRETVDTAKTEVIQMQQLRTALLAEYPADEVGIQVNIHSANGTTVRALVVRIRNPGFELPEQESARKESIRRVAQTIAAHYPSLSRYDRLRIEIATDGGGSGYTSSTTSEFPTAELLAPGDKR